MTVGVREGRPGGGRCPPGPTWLVCRTQLNNQWSQEPHILTLTALKSLYINQESFIQFEIIINVLVSFIRFIRIPLF